MTDVVLPHVHVSRQDNSHLAKRAAVDGEFGFENAADGLIKPLEDRGTSASVVKAGPLEPSSRKILSPVKRPSSYEPESHTPPSSEPVKMVERPKASQGLEEQQQRQGQPLALAQQMEIQRMGSAAESLVDSWSPDLVRIKSTQSAYDTAPYPDTADEQPTVCLGRPASKRGKLPSFIGLSRGEGGPDDEENRLHGNDPAALGPIYSACHRTLDSDAPISLDDSLGGAGMFATNPYNAERPVTSGWPFADTRSDIGNGDEHDDGDHIVSGDEKGLSSGTQVEPARLEAPSSANSEGPQAEAPHEATDASAAAHSIVAAIADTSDGEVHGEGDTYVGEQLPTDERDVEPAFSPVPAWVNADGVETESVDESVSAKSAALLLGVDSAATSALKDIASFEDEGNDASSNEHSFSKEREVEPASSTAPTFVIGDNVHKKPTDARATGEPPASTPFVHSAAKSAVDSAATDGAMNDGEKNDCGASYPFFFDGTSNNDVTAMLGSPAVSMKSMKPCLGSPALSVLGKGAIITENGLSSADANHSTIWATAAAAAHALNASHTTVSDELKSMSTASAGHAKSENGSKLRQLIGLFKSTSRVVPGRVNRPPPGPDSNALPELPTTGRHDIPLTPVKLRLPEFVSATPSAAATPSKPSIAGPGMPAPFAGGLLGKTPLPSPTGNDSDEDTAEDTSTTASSSPGGLATARVEVEGDLEEGGAPATGGRAAVAAEAATAASARVATDSAVRVAVADHQMVLPCAPSDDEKVMYYKTGRWGMIALSLLSFYALSVGMWLFVIVTPAFYWFAVPAAFLMFYLACHYFGVALWGSDFRPGVHENILIRSREAGYEPTVDVFLPVCKEPTFLLANTWKYVSMLDYPRVSVHVLDDGACDEVRDLAAEFGFNYIVRDNRPELKKAGNLRYAFTQTSGEAIAIFDADFCPRPDFLNETIPYFGQFPAIGILQTPQFFRYREEQTWVEKGAGVTQEFFYRLVQVNQDKFNAAVCVGSCGLYRRAALEPFGGVAAIAHSEDMYTGYKMTELGYTIKYLPLNLAMGACPDEPQTFFMQQYRWCMGSACLVTEREFWRSNISNIHKLCFVNGLLYYIATALLVFVAPIPILLLVWMRADGVLWYHSLFAIPSILFAAIVMPCWAKQKYGMACHRVKIIQCYAHMYAIKDRIMGRSAPWVPSGVGASTASVTYKSSVRLLLAWNIIITVLIVGGSAWRITEHTWYHFVPAIVLAVGSFVLNMSTLIY